MIKKNGICILLCISKAIVIHGEWILHNNYKAAVNPYNSLFTSSSACQSNCLQDSNCNGYSINIFDNGCFLSMCDNYMVVPSCSSCYFASKSPPSNPIVCPSETTILDSGDFNTTTLETTTVDSKTRTTTANTGASSTSVVLDTTTNPTVLNTTITDHVLLVSTTPALDNLNTTQFPITATKDVSKGATDDSGQTTSDPNYTDTFTLDPKASESTKTDFAISAHVTMEMSMKDMSTTNSLHNYNTGDVILTIGNVTCVCVCKYVNTSLEKSLEKRKKALVLNRTKLSSSIRKRISAHDSRISCRAIGVMGIAIMVIFVLLIFCVDISSLFISVKDN